MFFVWVLPNRTRFTTGVREPKAIPFFMWGHKPDGMEFMARRWRALNSMKRLNRSVRMFKWATHSWRSFFWKHVWNSCKKTFWKGFRIWAQQDLRVRLRKWRAAAEAV